MVRLKAAVTILALVPLAFSHPGESAELVKREMQARNDQHAAATWSLATCQGSEQSVALKQRAATRRAAKVTDLRAKRGLTNKPLSHQKRDALTALEYWTTQNHNMSSAAYTLDTPEATIFGSNNTCALVPETTIGPYYVTGEHIRSNITEGQAGVPMHIELQFHCNAKGVYYGIDESEGEGGLNSTFLRGVQASDEEGVAAFDTLFPGHYDSRITHFHLVVQTNVTYQPNDTYTGGNTLHVGQVYFEDALVEAVEATDPSNTNTIAFTTWELDGWMLEEATTDYDPFVEYVQLSDDLEDGLLAWITVALDLSSDHSSNLTAAAHYYGTGELRLRGVVRDFRLLIPMLRKCWVW